MRHCSAAGGGGGGQKPICAICYEDLKPAIEDLQTNPLCGHVFHELCLQQWLEYCPAGKKPTCPMCKQSCSHSSLIRLYFQSTGGDPTQLSQSSPPSKVDAEALAEEVTRLEGKVSSLQSSLQSQQSHLRELEDELSLWKEAAKREAARAEEIKKEKESVDRFLQFKLEELSRKIAECTKLEERSLGLAKELAALKLATDLNLSEEDMVKLASLGHGRNSNNSIDVLRKSLALRNKSYKELMVQCNLLGRSESRALQNLDKAKEKMAKLKARLQELEKTFEEKENGTLRDLKASMKTKVEPKNLNYVEKNLGSPNIDIHSLQDQTGNCDISVTDPNNKGFSNNHPTYPYRHANVLGLKKNLTLMSEKENVIDLETDACFIVDKDTVECPRGVHKPLVSSSDHQNQTPFYKNKNMLSSSDPEAYTFNDIGIVDRSSSSNLGLKNHERTLKENVEKNVIHAASSTERMFDNDIFKDALSLPLERDAQAHNSVAIPGDQPFVGGHFGPEGGNKIVGKWCRQVQTKSDIHRMRDSTYNSSLIATGADGRGGRVKVLRSQDDFLEGKGHALWPKRTKTGSSKQSGQFQIEHFFGKESL